MQKLNLNDDKVIGFTRPVEFVINESKYLFTSCRGVDGTYTQKAYLLEEEICEVRVTINNKTSRKNETELFYGFPFRYLDKNYILMALDTLGVAGFYLGEIFSDERN